MRSISIALLGLWIVITGCSSKNSHRRIDAVAVHSPAQASSGEPYLFSSGESIHMSWIRKDDKRSELWYSQLNDTSWLEPILVDSGSNWFVNWADYPMIAANDEALVAHYLVRNGEVKYAYDVSLVSSSNSGESWNKIGKLNDDGKQAEHGFVSIMPYRDGFFITWLDGRNAPAQEEGDHGDHGQMSLRAAILDAQGTKIEEWQLDDRTCDCCQTTASITDNGPVVVYRDRSNEEIRDMSIMRYVNGVWTEPVSIHDDNWKIAGCPVNGPSSASEGNNLAVAWFSAPNDQPQVHVVFSDDGGATFGDPIRVDEGKTIGRVDIVMLDDKSCVVSWMEGSMIKASIVDIEGVRETFVVAESTEARASGFPQMARMKSILVFAWTDEKAKSIKTAFINL